MRGKAHGDETQAAVIAALLAGQGVSEVAKAYNLDHSVVSRWRQKIPEGQLHELARKKGEEVEELLFGYLSANLSALKVQSNVASDEAWLKRFSPQQLSLLHGVMADKAVRLLEALNRDPEEQGSAIDTEPD